MNEAKRSATDACRSLEDRERREDIRVNKLRIRSFQVKQALQWLPCGLRLWRRQLLAAFIPAGLFMLAALLLRRLPVLGDVLLLLLLPTVFTSFLVQAHIVAGTGQARAPWAKNAQALAREIWRDVRQTLFGAWSATANIFPLIVTGIVLVIVGLIAYVLLHAVGGQAVVSPYGFFELPAMQMVRLLLAYAVVALLWMLVASLLFWTLPLFALRDRVLVDALGLNLRALRNNVLPLMVYLLVFAAGLVPLAAFRLWSPVAGFLVLWLGGTALAVLFGFSAYCSFRLVFADAESAPRPAGGPTPPGSQP